MTLHDDPRLTRYALGEMSDEDRAAFEATLGDADRAEVDAIRALGGALAGELKAEPTMTAPPAVPARFETRRRTHWMLAAAAAVTIAGIGFTAGVWSTRREPPSAIALRPVGPAAMRSSNESRAATTQPPGYVGDLRASGPQPSAALASVSAGVKNERQPQAVAQKMARQRASVSVAAKDKSPVAADESRVAIPDLLTDPTDWPDLAARRNASPSIRTVTPSAAPVATAEGVDHAIALSSARGAATPALKSAGKISPVDANDSFLIAADADGDGIADHKLGVGGFGGGGGFDNRGERFERSAESYAHLPENPFVDPRATPLSTFGIDVDTASYANVRRFLTTGQRPPGDAVRVEELINYFPTSDAPPTDGKPFAVHAEVARCPWNAGHDLVRVALKAKEVAVDHRPTSNLVFLIDVSGSMNEPDKLPLVKRGLGQLVDQLTENDRVAIVVYAGNSGLALPSTNAADKATIRAAIDHLEAGGSTNGGQGIELAYATAAANFVRGGANRVILCTDGDFNVGVVDRGSLLELIQQKAKAGTFLNVLGFGTGNVKDDTMEMLADKGNGQYAYVDTDREAHKVFVEQASGTLVTVAKDVKIQVEFNPAAVASYRLIGYENRALAKEDFNNDLKDAGEIGAGHNVVALYEIERVGARLNATPDVDKLKYQPSAPTPAADANAELLTLKLRYKAPDAPLEQGVSQLIEQPLTASDRAIEQASADFQFDAAVAGFGMLLRGSSAKGECDWAMVTRLAKSGVGADGGGHRAEFLTLVDKAATLVR